MTKVKVPGTKRWYKIADTEMRILYACDCKVGTGGVISINKTQGTPKIIPGSKTIYSVSHSKKGTPTKRFTNKADAKKYAKKIMLKTPGQDP